MSIKLLSLLKYGKAFLNTWYWTIFSFSTISEKNTKVCFHYLNDYDEKDKKIYDYEEKISVF